MCVEDSKNPSTYDYTNGYSYPSESSDRHTSDIFEVVSKIGRWASTPNYDPFNLVGIRNSREEEESLRVVGERKGERDIEEEEEEIVEGRGNKLETCRQT